MAKDRNRHARIREPKQEPQADMVAREIGQSFAAISEDVAMAATSEERRKVAENVEAEEQESPDDFDFDASFEITCEEVINSIRESALARLGIGCGARVVNDA